MGVTTFVPTHPLPPLSPHLPQQTWIVSGSTVFYNGQILREQFGNGKPYKVKESILYNYVYNYCS